MFDYYLIITSFKDNFYCKHEQEPRQESSEYTIL